MHSPILADPELLDVVRAKAVRLVGIPRPRLQQLEGVLTFVVVPAIEDARVFCIGLARSESLALASVLTISMGQRAHRSAYINRQACFRLSVQVEADRPRSVLLHVPLPVRQRKGVGAVCRLVAGVRSTTMAPRLHRLFFNYRLHFLAEHPPASLPVDCR